MNAPAELSPVIAVVGASLAGLRAAESIREHGFAGAVVVASAEARLPYDRPPLSKALLAGDWEPERIQLRRPEQLAALALDLRLGVRATGLDLAARELSLDDGSVVAFDGCVIATGARPRRLPGPHAPLAGVHELRTLDDGLALRAELHGNGERRVVVIGGGFIGSEVAATARKLGHHVTVLEALAAPMIRGLGAAMGAALGAVHTANGVDLRCGVGVAGLVGEGRVTGVRLDDTTVVPADVVLVGVGVVPDTDWLAGSGLTIDNGIVCDAHLRAAPGVFAAGDVARFPFGPNGVLTRIEHWTNANEQGGHAGANVVAHVAGDPTVAFDTVPFVWSDQYDRRIQIVGRVSGEHEMALAFGSIDEGSWVAIYGDGERLAGALAVNQPKRLMRYRKLLLTGASWSAARDHAAADAV
jgi:NADPH-dependent 2,4-dienoyl-CoA reductase/sulfur reductase-like enzyme